LAARLKIQPAPARISKLDFDEICDSFAISPQKNRDFLRAMVDSSTDFVADFVKQQASQPQLRDDRKSVKDAISALEKVRRLLDRVGPEGKVALTECEYFLGPLVCPAWLHHRFPGDPLAPKSAGLAGFLDPTLAQRRLFIQNRPTLVITAICEELARVFGETLLWLKSHPTAKGGRRRAFARHLLIQSLIRAWTLMGRQPSTDPKSDFVKFVEAIVVSIGWSERGLPSAVAKAAKDSRIRARKKAR
jgi:hypothetical protein